VALAQVDLRQGPSNQLIPSASRTSLDNALASISCECIPSMPVVAMASADTYPHGSDAGAFAACPASGSPMRSQSVAKRCGAVAREKRKLAMRCAEDSIPRLRDALTRDRARGLPFWLPPFRGRSELDPTVTQRLVASGEIQHTLRGSRMGGGQNRS